MEDRIIVEVFVFGELIVIGTHEIEIEDSRIESILRTEDGKSTISICIGEID